MIYNAEIVQKDVPGNIVFGFLGKAFSIPDEVLIRGAGAAQKITET